ncbi:hypothetical protein QQ020_23785 [Fulvivirgaceae bacterium BMA12]|uniref:Uncharacterized protein n=1 Tax=Agaribacillus aureus TaxID=3051825 RepID=A0ABT8LBU7_9BACT|nr:hypothetical protein [Fulvivirgaceae bacterium BMA12]
MSRLFYEAEKSSNKFKSGSENGHKRAKLGLEKIASLVPAEIIATYLTILGFISDNWDFQTREIVTSICIAICTILTPIYLRKMSTPGKPIKVHLIMSTIAFLIWAYATSGDRFPLVEYESSIASIILVLFTLISGAIPLNK